MSRLLFAMLFALVAISIPSAVAAQCVTDNGTDVQPGDTDPENSCFYCDSLSLEMENLPAGTRCGDDQTVHCDSQRVWVARCAETVAGDESSMFCDDDFIVSATCPDGFQCDTAQQTCKQTCDANTECQDGWECVDSACERLPPPDMGIIGGDDMGTGGDDMGTGGDDMGTGSGDMGTTPDTGVSADTGKGGGDDGGCCATSRSVPVPPALLALLFGFFFQRRLRGRVRETS